jgi:hypothetical protein
MKVINIVATTAKHHGAENVNFHISHGRHNEPHHNGHHGHHNLAHQALAFAAPQSAPAPSKSWLGFDFSNNSSANNFATVPSLGRAYRNRANQRKTNIISRLLSSMTRGNLPNYYQAAKALKRALRNNDYMPSAFNNTYGLSAPKGDYGRPSPSSSSSSLLSYFVPQKNITTYHDDHHNDRSLDNAGYGFSLPTSSRGMRNNLSASMKGTTATIESKRYNIGADQNGQKFSINKKNPDGTIKNVLAIEGDPHALFANGKRLDFKGKTSFKLDDGTIVTDVTVQKGTNDKNAPTYTDKVVVTNKNGQSKEISNIAGNLDGGLITKDLKPYEALAARHGSSNFVRLHDDGNYEVKRGEEFK